MGDEKTFPLKENIGNWHFSQFSFGPEILDNNDFTHKIHVQGVPAYYGVTQYDPGFSMVFKTY